MAQDESRRPGSNREPADHKSILRRSGRPAGGTRGGDRRDATHGVAGAVGAGGDDLPGIDVEPTSAPTPSPSPTDDELDVRETGNETLDDVFRIGDPTGTGPQFALRFLRAVQQRDYLAAARELDSRSRLALSNGTMSHLRRAMDDVHTNANRFAAGVTRTVHDPNSPYRLRVQVRDRTALDQMIAAYANSGVHQPVVTPAPSPATSWVDVARQLTPAVVRDPPGHDYVPGRDSHRRRDCAINHRAPRLVDAPGSAYVLVQTVVSEAGLVARAAAKLPGVIRAEEVTGPYDVIVYAVSSSLADLSHTMYDIGALDGVTRMSICPHYARELS